MEEYINKIKEQYSEEIIPEYICPDCGYETVHIDSGCYICFACGWMMDI